MCLCVLKSIKHQPPKKESRKMLIINQIPVFGSFVKDRRNFVLKKHRIPTCQFFSTHLPARALQAGRYRGYGVSQSWVSLTT
jgi:hypothetical protein